MARRPRAVLVLLRKCRLKQTSFTGEEMAFLQNINRHMLSRLDRVLDFPSRRGLETRYSGSRHRM